jgi:hypothetical protein
MERFVGFVFSVSVQARDLLDGGATILHLYHHCGHLQSADRFVVAHFVHVEPRQQMARHAAFSWVILAMSCLAWLWLFDPSIARSIGY